MMYNVMKSKYVNLQSVIDTLKNYRDSLGYTSNIWNDMIDDILDLPVKRDSDLDWTLGNVHLPDTSRRVQVQINNGWIVTAYYEAGDWFSVPAWTDEADVPIEDKYDPFHRVVAWRELPDEIEI